MGSSSHFKVAYMLWSFFLIASEFKRGSYLQPTLQQVAKVTTVWLKHFITLIIV